jgi:ribosomal protein L32
METKPSVNTAGRFKLKHRGVECLNCGHPLDISHKYCPNCSQANSTRKLTLKDFFDEFFSNIISYDSRLLKTLAALLLRPGRITKDYIAGKRVSYTNPFRFLLSLAIIYFLLMSLSGDFDQLNRYGTNATDNPFNLNVTDIDGLDFGDEKEKKELLAGLDSLKLGEKISKQTRIKDSIILANPKKQFDAVSDDSFFSRHFGKQEIFVTLIEKDSIYNLDEAVTKYGIENSKGNQLAFNAAQSMVKAKREPGAYLNSLISKLPFTTFFFLPVFTIFVWLAYIRKKHTYTDHLIFSFHNQSLLFILLIISSLIDSVFGTASSGIFLLIFSIYLYKAMRNFYKQGRFKTIVKYVFLNTIFVILASIGVVVLLAGSLFTY